MRLGTLMFGAALGAGAMYYFSNKSKTRMLMSGMTNMISMMGTKAQNISPKTILNQAKKASGFTAGNAQDSISEIKKIIDQDPVLKATVDDILKASGQGQSFQTAATVKAATVSHPASPTSSSAKSSTFTQ